MSVSTQVSFSLSETGQQIVIPNLATQVANTGSLSVSYSYSGTPTSITIAIEGLTNNGGTIAILDSYSGTVNVSNRSVSLAGLVSNYDAFRISGIWIAPTGFNVSGTMGFSGTGSTFSALTQLSTVHTM